MHKIYQNLIKYPQKSEHEQTFRTIQKTDHFTVRTV